MRTRARAPVVPQRLRRAGLIAGRWLRVVTNDHGLLGPQCTVETVEPLKSSTSTHVAEQGNTADGATDQKVGGSSPSGGFAVLFGAGARILTTKVTTTRTR